MTRRVKTRTTTTDDRMGVRNAQGRIIRCTRSFIMQQQGGEEALRFWDNMLSPMVSLLMLWKSRAFRKAVDWLIGVGIGMYYLYYCPGCHIAPLQARGWYLMNAEWDAENDTYKSGSNKGYQWRCAMCLLDFVSEYLRYRMLVLTEAVYGKNYFFYFQSDKGQGVKENALRRRRCQ